MINQCSGFWIGIGHRGCAKGTSIFVLRNYSYSPQTSDVVRWDGSDYGGSQKLHLWSMMLKQLECSRLVPQAISSEEELMIE